MNSPPSSLGQYQIIREIARSNDIVYEAYDPLMNRRVAIKELAMPQGASGPQQEERTNRFKREAQAAGTLNHPNIMTVFSFAEDAGRTFMAMEYLDGGTLRNEIDTKGALPTARAIEIATNILAGLGHAHSKGVIHRDIKPDNIQILANGTVKITDFGIARLTFQPNLTMDGQVFGTPSYMSPEQVVGKDIDQRSDLFSVGVVLYEMLAGQKPFGGDSVVSITYAIMNAEPARLTQIDHALWQVIARALDKSPQMRYANADEMVRALKDSQASTQAPIAGSVSGPTPVAYGANPYMSPSSMPQAPVQPIYSYNPYQAQPQPQMVPPPPPTPYQTTPYQGGQYQTTPYQPNSYQGAPYQGAQYPYQAGPSMQPPGQLPIYYPPPPRVPLMKPETVAVLKKTLITFVLVATLMILVLLGIRGISESLRNAIRDRMDNNSLPHNLTQLPANMPPTEKIAVASQELSKQHSDGATAEIKRYMSNAYAQNAMQFMERADLVHAELEFTNGAKVDPTNAIPWSGLAKVLKLQSLTQDDLERKASLLITAGDDWTKAATLDTDSSNKDQDSHLAADAYLAYGEVAIESGDRSQRAIARQKLYEIRTGVSGDSTLSSQIMDMLGKLSN